MMEEDRSVSLPALRKDLELLPTVFEGQRMLALRDPQELSEGVLLLGQHEVFFISLLNGGRSILDLQEAFMRRFGELVYSERIEKLLRMLDERCLLENDRYLQRMSEEILGFQESDTRSSSLAGLSYEEDPEKLREILSGHYTVLEGPGLPEKRAQEKGRLCGVVAPHIDLTRGGICYAHAHKAIAEQASTNSTFLILGTAHMPGESPVVLTRKGFQTPLGTLRADTELIDEILSRLSFDAMEDEYLHRREHSVEFQVLFLQNDFPGALPRILPLLVGPFDEKLTGRSDSEEKLEEFLGVVRDLMDEGRDLFLVASVDLSHMGPRFGARKPLDREELTRVAELDRSMLETVAQGRCDLFREEMLSQHLSRNVCGYPSIYCLLKLLEGRGVKGNLLRYEQCVDPNSGDLVSIASMTFHSGDGNG